MHREILRQLNEFLRLSRSQVLQAQLQEDADSSVMDIGLDESFAHAQAQRLR